MVSCSKSQMGTRTEHLTLIAADSPDTKVLVDGTTGAISWLANVDNIAVYIKGTGAGYKTLTVGEGGSVDLSLQQGQSRDFYVIFPAASAVSSYYGNTTLYVNYPSSYNLSGLTLEQIANYCPYPMVAANDGSDLIAFYQVGGVLRLTIGNVPVDTQNFYLTFTGKTITGNVNVTNGGTQYTTTNDLANTTSYLTYTIASTSIGGDSPQTVTLNIPLPQGNYSNLSSISIYARSSSNSNLKTMTYTLPSRWTTVTRAQGRKISVAFN